MIIAIDFDGTLHYGEYPKIDNAPFNVAKYNGANTRKVYADVYIDDHNVGGLPPWEEIYRLIAAMKVVSC